MMLKSVVLKIVRGARNGRNLSGRGVGGGRGLSSSHSPKDNSGREIKTIIPLWRGIYKVGKKAVCGVSGIASGYAVAAAILPNHSEPLIISEQINRDLMELTKRFIVTNDKLLKRLEEEGV